MGLRIFAAGLITETNTFSPLPTSLEDFQVQRGTDVAAGRIVNPSLNLSALWGEMARARGDEFVFGLNAWAQPSGTTIRSAYESLRDEILRDLKAAMPVDAVLLMLHGAMVAHGYDDCEGDLIRRVRDIVGPDAAIGVELDLHCHLNEASIAPADIVVIYKEYPHVDINDRAREVFDLTVATKLGKIRPVKALFECRMIGSYPTSYPPLRGFVDAMSEAERRPGVLSVSFGHGFRLADLPDVGSKVLVVADNDPALAEKVSREFGLRVYGLRREIGFESRSLSLDEALTRALANTKTAAGKTTGRPTIVADQSDNPGSGAPGDSTFALQWLLERQAKDVAMAIFCDPEVVRIAKKAGPGATLAVRLGGKLGPASGKPLDIEVTVLSILDSYMHEWPQQTGASRFIRAGDVAALRCGGIDLVVASERSQCLSPSIFTDLGIDFARKKLLVVKSIQHFYGAFAPIAGEVIYMSGPGAAPVDPRRITYRRLDTGRLYPWNADPLASAV